MLKYRTIALFLFGFFGCCIAYAQSPIVPYQLHLGDMQIKFTRKARKIVQKEVYKLTKNKQYFQKLLDKANLFFPLIEKTLREEGVPDAIKYLAIQESALIADAVSSSQAVGFWQFKDFTAIEVGLHIDRHIDQRMHLIESTRGAAKYLKESKQLFDNWCYALISYMTGRSGAQPFIRRTYIGAKKMRINHRAHWYLLRFLAHKIAFEKKIGKVMHPELYLKAYKSNIKAKLSHVAQQLNIDYNLLKSYNRWVKNHEFIIEKHHTLVVPLKHGTSIFTLSQKQKKRKKQKIKASKHPIPTQKVQEAAKPTKQILMYPIICLDTAKQILVNGIPGIIARPMDNIELLSQLGKLSIENFILWNDLHSHDKIKPGQVYYFANKNAYAAVPQHIVQQQESLWHIAQQYGVQLSILLANNTFEINQPLLPGHIVYFPAVKQQLLPVPTYNDSKILSGKVDTVSTTNHRIIQKTDTIVHTVLKGENLSKLAEAYQTSVQCLLTWNNLTISTPLPIGKKLYIYKYNARPQQTSTIHEVKEGDTLYNLAQKYSVTIQELITWNKLSSGRQLQVGNKIMVHAPSP